VKPKGKLPTVLVVHENRGLNPHIEDITRRLALDNFIAFAPDALFPLGGYPGDEEKATALFRTLDQEKVRNDFIAAAGYLKKLPEGSGKVGAVGFCLGGSVAYLCATRLNGLSASVCFYGGKIVKDADEKPKCPLQMHFGEMDAGIPMATVEEIKKKQPQAETYVYPGAAHGFYCDERASYNKDAAALAWSRTQEFLAKNMK